MPILYTQFGYSTTIVVLGVLIQCVKLNGFEVHILPNNYQSILPFDPDFLQNKAGNFKYNEWRIK